MKTILLSMSMLVAACVAGGANAAPDTTRTLTASPAVPAGAAIAVENLLGHMTVTQGPKFAVTATVVAGGKDAQALSQSIKLDVTDASGKVTVHVHYPLDRYTTYRFGTENRGNEFCVLGVCFHGSYNASLHYQGQRVRIANNGVPLRVDVAVQLPRGASAQLVNKVGLLEANGLTDTLAFGTAGGDVSATGITGNVTVSTDGGDVHLKALKGSLDATTGGGDAYITDANGRVLRLQTGGGDGKLDIVTGALDANTAGGDLYVKQYTSGQSVALHTGGGDLQIAGNFAAAHAVSVDTAGGDATVTAERLAASVDASTGGGTLHLRGMTGGSLAADTAGGDAYLNQIVAPVHLRAGGGSAHFDGVTGSLDVGTAGGDLSIKQFVAGPNVSLQTGGGYLQLAGNLAATRKLDITTAGGNVAIDATGMSLHLKVSSSGGNIATHLPTARNEVSGNDRFTADVGTAQGNGTVSSGGGDVTLGAAVAVTASGD